MNNIENIKNVSTKDLTNPNNSIFPLEVFPDPVRNFIIEYEKYRGMWRDHMGLASIMVSSSSIGNTYRVMGRKEVSAALFGVLVGSPGSAKSDVVELAYKRIVDLHVENQSKYQEGWRKYEYKMMEWKSYTPKKRLAYGIIKPEEPKLERVYLDKTTPEAFGDALLNSRRSVTLVKDEIADFIGGLRSSMKEDLLSIWSNNTYSRSTRTKGEQFVQKPFLNIIGTTQPERLDAFAKNKGIESGFSSRFLFAYPEERTSPVSGDINDAIVKDYDYVISRLLDKLLLSINRSGTPEPTILNFLPSAFDLYEDWRMKFKEAALEVDNVELSIVGKLENYSLRFALILQLMYWAACEDDKKAIGHRAVEGAIRLTEYFHYSSLRAHQEMKGGAVVQGVAAKALDVVELFNEGYNYVDIQRELVLAPRDVKDLIYENLHLINPQEKRRLRGLR